VRERVVAGDTDEEVLQYLVDRYGEYVLLKPVFAPHTLVLWAAAPLVLVIGGIAIVIATRRKRAIAVPAEGLTRDEQQALDELQQ
jgi:cytochrome c-type biogenesis protein CcmH